MVVEQNRMSPLASYLVNSMEYIVNWFFIGHENVHDQQIGPQDNGLRNIDTQTGGGQNNLNVPEQFESISDNTAVDENPRSNNENPKNVTQGTLNVINNINIAKVDNFQVQQGGNSGSKSSLSATPDTEIVDFDPNSYNTGSLGNGDNDAGAKWSTGDNDRGCVEEYPEKPIIAEPENDDTREMPYAELQGTLEAEKDYLSGETTGNV